MAEKMMYKFFKPSRGCFLTAPAACLILTVEYYSRTTENQGINHV